MLGPKTGRFMPTGHSHSALLVMGLQRECEIARGRVSFTTARMACEKAQTALICQQVHMKLRSLFYHVVSSVKIRYRHWPTLYHVDSIRPGSICMHLRPEAPRALSLWALQFPVTAIWSVVLGFLGFCVHVERYRKLASQCCVMPTRNDFSFRTALMVLWFNWQDNAHNTCECTQKLWTVFVRWHCIEVESLLKKSLLEGITTRRHTHVGGEVIKFLCKHKFDIVVTVPWPL